MLRSLAIPESQQRIFQSEAAALEEVQRVGGVTLTIGFAIAKDLAAGRLTHVTGPGLDRSGEWCVATLPPSARQPAVSELVRFITTPRCIQAIIRGNGVGVTSFAARFTSRSEPVAAPKRRSQLHRLKAHRCPDRPRDRRSPRFNVAPGAQVRTRTSILGYQGQHLGPRRRASPPDVRAVHRNTLVQGRFRSSMRDRYPRYHCCAHIGSVDDMHTA